MVKIRNFYSKGEENDDLVSISTIKNDEGTI